MNTDNAFDQCCILLDTATSIWQSRTKSRFADAEEKYKKAIEIYEIYFSDHEKYLENSIDPF
jgi:hypothetical protein